MRVGILLGIVVLVSPLGGCGDPHGFVAGFGLQGTRGHVTGVVAEGTTANDFTLVDLRYVIINGVSIDRRSRLKGDDLIEVELHSQRAAVVAIEPQRIDGDLYYSDALVGAGLDTGDVAVASLTKDDPTRLQLDSGWALMWGIRPRFRGRIAAAVTESTTFAVQMVNSGVYRERYFLISGSVRVDCLVGSGTQTLTAPDSFVEVTSDSLGCHIAVPVAVPADTAAIDEPADFLIAAKKQAEVSGWAP